MMPPIFLPTNIKDSQSWDNLHGCSLPLAITQFCQLHKGITVVVTPENLSSSNLLEELHFFMPEDNAPEILCFPDWETLPYDQFSPHEDIISERLATLCRLPYTSHAIIVGAASTLMHRLCPKEFLNQFSFTLKPGQKITIAPFRQQLEQAGYHVVNKVMAHGEFAVRGGIVDLYPMGSKLPFRIELFDDVIESLRIFNPETQLTLKKIDKINLLPAHEFPIDENGIATFRRKYRDMLPGNPSQCPLYTALSEGRVMGGIEYYLPLFFDATASIFDFLPTTARVCLIDDINEHATRFWQEVNARYTQRAHDITRPILAPSNCFFSPTELLTDAKKFNPIRLSQDTQKKKGLIHHFSVKEQTALPITRRAAEPLQLLNQFIQKSTTRILLIAESAGRREVLLDLLKQSDCVPKVQDSWHTFLQDNAPLNITIGPLIQGAELIDSNITIITEAQLFGEQSTPQRRAGQKSLTPDLIIRDLAELSVGAPVVHMQFGVGRYQGLQSLAIQDNILNDFLVLSYAGDDKIYVPVTSLQLISRYTGADAEHAPLHKLGSDTWAREKKKAIEKIHDIAIELLDIYAKREAKPGHVYEIDKTEYQRFASGFPFIETTDQQQAIQAIINDLQSTRPMDRLICGDVGFGKTEVAMRAAFIAIQNGKQVAILVPTTLLAGQHFETFRDRFAEFPITIELLSRFRSQKDAKIVLQSLQDGRTDLVIGTHKLLQGSVAFKNLGLLIVDEEHRFGVKQKEQIKALRTNVDILSMTATPIPRTLNMAMAGMRDISLIATPPAKRLAIKTFWQERNDSTLREAILREILRGGQVFLLHNNIDTIIQTADSVQKLVPEATVRHAHGQLRERDLEKIMSDFYHHRFNVLVCTTIIETGIDIPTANTMIIDRANKFGLAQLHQLRGRVGRSHHQAYAYLFTPPEKSLSTDAIKRLEAIVSLEDLGAGFTLATHDLEIRGAGELLGDEQSGHVQAIGFTLFMEMLDTAVNDLKAGRTPALAAPMKQGPEIDLHMSARIPDEYISDIHTRLIFYKRIANATDMSQLHNLQIELIDRFGLLPPAAKRLLAITTLKFTATKLGITRMQAHAGTGSIVFNANPNINVDKLITLVSVHSTRYRLEGMQKLRFTLDGTTPEAILDEVSKLLTTLGS